MEADFYVPHFAHVTRGPGSAVATVKDVELVRDSRQLLRLERAFRYADRSPLINIEPGLLSEFPDNQ